MSGLEREGVREAVAAMVADGLSAKRIRDALLAEFPGIEVGARTVQRWCLDPQVERLAAQTEEERDRRADRLARAELLRRLEAGDPEVTTGELIRVLRQAKPDATGHDYGRFLGDWPDIESAIEANLYHYLSEHPIVAGAVWPEKLPPGMDLERYIIATVAQGAAPAEAPDG